MNNGMPQVAILAGGLATRLGNLASKQPKSMIRVMGKPFLQYQLELLKRNGIRNVVLCTGNLGEQIEGYFGDGEGFGVNIRYSHEEKLLGTAGAIRKAAHLLDDIFFTMYGDSYLFVDFEACMSYFKSQGKLALMTVYENHDRYDRSNTVIDGNLVRKFSNKEKTKDMVHIEYGANVFREEVLEMVPESEPYALDDLFPRLAEKQELLAFEVKERFYEIGSLSGLEDFTEFVRRTFAWKQFS